MRPSRTCAKSSCVGRHLRRRHGRHRDDRPAHPPLRDPQPQRRQLPATRQRPRRPNRRQNPRNRLTIPLGRVAEGRRTPHNASIHPARPVRRALKRPSPPRPRPTGSASRRRSLSPQLTLEGSVLNRRGGPVFNRREWSSFRPALTALTITLGEDTPLSGDASPRAPRPPGASDRVIASDPCRGVCGATIGRSPPLTSPAHTEPCVGRAGARGHEASGVPCRE